MLLDNPFRSDARVEKEATSLIEAGYHVTMWVEKDPALPTEEIIKGIRVIRKFDDSFKQPFSKAHKAQLAKISSEIRADDFDAVHCHDYMMLPYGGMAKARDPRLKLVYDSHEYLPGWPLHETSEGLANKAKGYIVWQRRLRDEKKFAQKADAMIVVNQPFVTPYRKDLGLNYDPTVVSNFPKRIPEEELTDTRYFHQTFDLPADTTVIAHIGNIYLLPAEIERLVKVISGREKLALVFMGNNTAYHQLKDQHQSTRNIYFGDYRTQRENVILLASADIGICHVKAHWDTLRLTMTNRFMEYTYARLAVICNKYDGVHHITDKYKNTVYYHSLLEEGVFEQALDDTLARQKEMQDASEQARPHYHWEHEATKLVGLYQSLIGTP